MITKKHHAKKDSSKTPEVLPNGDSNVNEVNRNPWKTLSFRWKNPFCIASHISSSTSSSRFLFGFWSMRDRNSFNVVSSVCDCCWMALWTLLSWSFQWLSAFFAHSFFPWPQPFQNPCWCQPSTQRELLQALWFFDLALGILLQLGQANCALLLVLLHWMVDILPMDQRKDPANQSFWDLMSRNAYSALALLK